MAELSMTKAVSDGKKKKKKNVSPRITIRTTEVDWKLLVVLGMEARASCTLG